MSRMNEYKKSIRRSFKWEAIKAEASREGDVWLGTIFALTPSGKMYAPFACSNVMGCKRCKGSGTVANRKADAAKFKAADERNAELLADLLANHGPWFAKAWPKDKAEALEASRMEAKANQPTRTCDWCNGNGSHEAAKDEDWWFALASICREHGLAPGRFEGDADDGVWVCDPEFSNDNVQEVV
jgi:hypothetical protein